MRATPQQFCFVGGQRCGRLFAAMRSPQQNKLLPPQRQSDIGEARGSKPGRHVAHENETVRRARERYDTRGAGGSAGTAGASECRRPGCKMRAVESNPLCCDLPSLPALFPGRYERPHSSRPSEAEHGQRNQHFEKGEAARRRTSVLARIVIAHSPTRCPAGESRTPTGCGPRPARRSRRRRRTGSWPKRSGQERRPVA